MNEQKNCNLIQKHIRPKTVQLALATEIAFPRRFLKKLQIRWAGISSLRKSLYFNSNVANLRISKRPISPVKPDYLRNKLHLSVIHRSTKAKAPMLTKWHPKGFTLTLHETHCVHTSKNVRKMKFISYIYTLFLHRFCSLRGAFNIWPSNAMHAIKDWCLSFKIMYTLV